MLLNKTEIPTVAMDFMNKANIENVEIINELFELILTYEENPNDANKNLLNIKYNQWCNHTASYFKNEEAAMKEKDFPPHSFHQAEHDKTLSIMNNLFDQWQKTNDIQILKKYFEIKLPKWLTYHVQTMDTITAVYLKTGFTPCSMKKTI